MIGAGEILIIVLAILYMFGGKKFADWIKKVKKAKDEFKKAIEEDDDSENVEKVEEPKLNKKDTKVP